MRRLLLLLLLAWPLAAATPVITNYKVTRLTSGALSATWTTSVTGATTKARCDYGYSSTPDRNTEYSTPSGSSSQRMCLIFDLTPSTTLYNSPMSRDTSTNWTSSLSCPVTCTTCTSADHAFFASSSPVAINCTTGQAPRVTVPAAPACSSSDTVVCDPTAPTITTATTPPTVTGDDLTVASNGSDFHSKWVTQAGKASADGLVHTLTIPAGSTFSPSAESLTQYTYPIVTSPGKVIIRTDCDPKLLPPPGVPYDPQFAACLVHIRPNASFSGLGSTRLFAPGTTGRAGVYFVGISTEAPDYTDSNFNLAYTITGIDTSTDTVTVSGSPPAANSTVIVDLAGTGILGAFGQQKVCQVSGSTFKLDSACGGNPVGTTCSGACADLTGSYGSGGTVKRYVAKVASVISNTTPVRVTVTGHGIPNFPTAAINATGSSGSTIKLSVSPAAYQLVTGFAVLAEGTSVGGCDGVRFKINSTSEAGTSVTLNSSACGAATTGTLRRVALVRIGGSSDWDLNRAWQVDKVDADNFDLIGSTAQGTVTGGWVQYDRTNLAQFLDTSDMTDITFDRGRLWGPEPWASPFGLYITGDSTRTGIINSLVWHANGSPIDPTTGNWQSISGSPSQAGANIVSGSSELVLDGTTFMPHSNLISDAGHQSGNFSIQRAIFWQSDWAIASQAMSNGVWYPGTYPLEFKSFYKYQIKGSTFHGAMSGFNQNGPFIEFANYGDPSGPYEAGDVDVENNQFIHGSSLSMIDQVDQSVGEYQRYPAERIKFSNNTIDVSSQDYCTPTAIAAQGNCGGSQGYILRIFGGINHLKFLNNSIIVRRSHDPIFAFGGNRSQSWQIDDNIITISQGSAADSYGFKQISNNQVPAMTQSYGGPALDEYTIRGTTTDPRSSADGNVFITGIHSSYSGSFAAKSTSVADASTLSRAEGEALSQLADGAQMLSNSVFAGSATACSAGTCPDSYVGRLLEVFLDRSWYTQAGYSGKGADMDALSDGQGLIRSPLVTANSTTQMTLTFHSPSNTECWYQKALFDTNWATTWAAANLANIDSWAQTANGATQSKTAVWGSLTPDDAYAYRVSCGRPVNVGKFTAGTP